MKNSLRNDLEYVEVNGHKLHIFRCGDISRPKLVLMSGSGTIAPMYDFKVLYATVHLSASRMEASYGSDYEYTIAALCVPAKVVFDLP
ncbi:hypothetical protein [Ruminococcus sp.]|uniref:hypothetical protein n=1 Tax=Ruminococcus sp. TaxID=41978 RepID=UPI0025DB38BF|nr:hypothetical protein [Ruminococcus sp.]MCR4638626.1 hypothetical protein [Ruminococcus sp.]